MSTHKLRAKLEERLMINNALKEWRDINFNPSTWASFESVTFPHHISCAVKWGRIHSDGSKEAAIQTIVWTLWDNGKTDFVRLTHL